MLALGEGSLVPSSGFHFWPRPLEETSIYPRSLLSRCLTWEGEADSHYQLNYRRLKKSLQSMKSLDTLPGRER